MVFRTWYSRLGTWISHRGFRVAFGHGLPLVVHNMFFFVINVKKMFSFSKSFIIFAKDETSKNN
jgi:hypothetical protein